MWLPEEILPLASWCNARNEAVTQRPDCPPPPPAGQQADLHPYCGRQPILNSNLRHDPAGFECPTTTAPWACMHTLWLNQQSLRLPWMPVILAWWWDCMSTDHNLRLITPNIPRWPDAILFEKRQACRHTVVITQPHSIALALCENYSSLNTASFIQINADFFHCCAMAK